MTRDAVELANLSRLLDQGLDLDMSERADWIEGLEAGINPLKPTLRKLLLSANAPDDLTLAKQIQAAVSDSASQRAGFDLGEGTQIGPFALIREIGRGGMGTVWLARRRDGLVKHLIAVKLPHTGFFYTQLADRMAQEREILGRLNHPGISRLVDAGITPSGQPWLALEYVEGAPLNLYCDQLGLSIRARINLFIQVLGAIQYAHSNLVIHRDLKPANILVTPEGLAIVLDFGIAKILSEDLTQATLVTQIGGRALTPDYASPEQIAGTPLTTASDVYSLGVILYELLVGTRPYRLARPSLAALEQAIESASIRRPSSCDVAGNVAILRGHMNPQKLQLALKGDLDTVLLTALKRSQSERYSSVDKFREDLTAVLLDEPVGARAESSWDAARRFVKRHQWAAGSTAAVICALAIGFSTTMWQARIAVREAYKQRTSKEFVIGLFAAIAEDAQDGATPSEGTARQMLALGTRQLFTQYLSDSAVRLDLLELICALDNRLELFDDASKSCDEAISLAARLYGNRGVPYAEALEGKAEVLIEKGETTRSIDIATQVLAILEKPSGSNAEIYAKANMLLGNASNMTGQSKGAESRHYLEAALNVLRRFDIHGDTSIRAKYYLARTWEADGNYVQAETIFRSGLQEAETIYGKTSYQAAFGYDNFGNMLRHLDRFSEAVPYLTAAVTTYSSLFGREHPDVANVQATLALAEAAAGRRVEAERVIREAIETVTASHGEDSATAADLRFDLAQLQMNMGLPAEAVASYERIFQSAAVRGATTHTDQSALKADEAAALLQLGAISAAEQLLDSAAAGNPEKSTQSVRNVRLFLHRGEAYLFRGNTLGAHGSFDAALSMLLDLRQEAEESLPSTLFSYSQLVPDPAVAVRLIARVNLSGIVKRFRLGATLSVDDSLELRTGLARLEQAAGELDKAQNDFQQALRMRIRYDNPHSPRLTQLYAMMAEFYVQRGDKQQAAALLAQAEASLAANPITLPPLIDYLRSVHWAVNGNPQQRSVNL